MKGSHKKKNMTNHTLGEPVDQSRLLNPVPPTAMQIFRDVLRSVGWEQWLLIVLLIGSCSALWYWAVQVHDQNLEQQFGHKHNNRTVVEQRNY
jgi:hypothetical protein